MSKVQLLPGTAGTYSFFCPGCGTWHTVHTKNEGFEHPVWGVNGDIDKPTFSPSLLTVHYMGMVPADENKSHYKGQRELRCHSFIRNGRIEYLQDCDHGLAGQTVEMVDLPLECPQKPFDHGKESDNTD